MHNYEFLRFAAIKIKSSDVISQNGSEYLYSTTFILCLRWFLYWSNVIHSSWVKLSSILRPYFQKWDNYSFIFQFFLLVEKIVSNDSNCGFMNHGSYEICPIVIQIWDMIYSIELWFHALHNKKCKKWIRKGWVIYQIQRN